MGAKVFTIGGVEKQLQPGWRLAMTINGRSTFNGRLPSVSGTDRPALDADFLMTDGGTPVFGGPITRAGEKGLVGGLAPIVTDFTASDNCLLAERRYVTVDIPAGATLKAALELVVPFLPGATLDAAQVVGPTLPAKSYADVRTDAVLNDFSVLSGGYLWAITSSKVLRMFQPGTLAAPFNIIQGAVCLAEGDIEVEPQRLGYANRVIVRSDSLRAVAEDAAAITARGLYELLVTAPDNSTQAALDATASTMLAKSLVQRKEVRYRTRSAGLVPGQTQTITAALRNINNTFLITDVMSVGVSTGPVYEVTAIEGTTYQEGWREFYQGAGGTTAVVAAGGGSALQRFAYPLGGTGVDAVEPNNAWVPASGGGAIGTNPFQAQISTVARGTRAATITGRLKAEDAGVSVKARLYDVTNGLVLPGESAAVTGTAWQTVTFGTTLTAGNVFYELQVFSATAGAWVRAAGFYLE